MQPTKSMLASVASALLLSAGVANGAACTGAPPFTDVAQGSNYCTDAEWLKNRAITLGCTSSTLFCPNDVVTRGAMALFMQRLGTAVSPEIIRTDASTGGIDLDAASPIIACQTADLTSTYPRRAHVTTTFSGQAAGPLEYIHEVYVSTDSGATWTFTNNNFNRVGTAAAHWVSSNTDYVADLNAGTPYRFGVRLGRLSGTADFSASRCFINFEVFSRTGPSSPFDSATPRLQPDY
jgi:hypothetical protein